jgi:hypothetical protein
LTISPISTFSKNENEPNLKMTFPAKTLVISHFHPFSKQVKNGRKVSISYHFWSFIGQKQPDWIRPTHNRVKRRMQSLSLLPGGEGQDEGGRYH